MIAAAADMAHIDFHHMWDSGSQNLAQDLELVLHSTGSHVDKTADQLEVH